MNHFKIGLVAVILAASIAGPASAYHCESLMNKMRKAADVSDGADELLATVKKKVRKGEFGAGELKGARQNQATQEARYDAIRAEVEDHCIN